ncbi:alpha/beta-hydrolase [Ascodesmis nigricans]|uniref:Alpha/beta-hydrolase n=1 Tax=Ascodesmis nigricans TaxID=341454 RepID=A0A4S2MMX0_9PEZI|nr:alpha/beta-hydrolase [Ascodesmis nigricans]
MHFTLLAAAIAFLTAVTAQTDQQHPCYALEHIVARGSTEPSPLGVNLGPALQQEVSSALGGDVLTIGLIYPATFDLPDSPETGIRNLVTRIKERSAQCPSMRFALSGYSQGADIVHHALTFHLTSYSHLITSISVFGDPLSSIGWPPIYQHRVINVCDSADRACGGVGTSGHTKYGKTELHKKAVQFIVDRFRVAAPTPGDTRATMKALPEPGEAAGFLLPWVRWPPREWKSLYTDGLVVEPVFR